MKTIQSAVILAQRLKPGAEFRLHANSVEPVCLEVRKLAARQVFKGESGKLQDLINFTLLALCNHPDIADKLYMEGKMLYTETLNTGIVPTTKMSNEMPS